MWNWGDTTLLQSLKASPISISGKLQLSHRLLPVASLQLWLVRGGVRAQDSGHHIDKPHLILAVELSGRFRFRLAPLDVAATVREKLFSSVRVQEQSVASYPRQSLLSSFAVRLPWLVSLFLSHFQGEAYELLARYILYIIFLLPCFFFFFFFFFFSNFFFF